MGVIAIGQSKGGVGKTTIAINLAGDIARHGRSVTLIDADPQESAVQWAKLEKLNFPVKPVVTSSTSDVFWIRDVLKTKSDVVVVDLPAGLDASFEAAVLIADLLLVPCGPSSIDLGAAQRTVARAREVRRREPVPTAFKVVTVANRVDSGTDEGAQIDDALVDLGEAVAPAISFDNRHVRSFAEGVTISDMPNCGGLAEEVRRLSVYLLRQIAPRPTFRVG